MTPEQRREMASKAGKASVASRRRKKQLKELLEIALAQKTETGDYYMDITKALIEKALNGSERAYEIIRSTLGQDPVQKVDLDTGSTIKINISGEDEQKD